MGRGERIVVVVWLVLVTLGFWWIGHLEGVQ